MTYTPNGCSYTERDIFNYLSMRSDSLRSLVDHSLHVFLQGLPRHGIQCPGSPSLYSPPISGLKAPHDVQILRGRFHDKDVFALDNKLKGGRCLNEPLDEKFAKHAVMAEFQNKKVGEIM